MKKHIFFVLLLALTMTLVCACGKGTSKKGNSSTGATSDGGSVIVGITNDMDSLDPHKAVAAGTREVLYNIFEGLVKADENGVMQPAVASEYSISEDATTYTFTLRDDVTFHNGNKVTASDVSYSLKRAAGFLDDSEDIKVVTAFSIISDITEQTSEDGKTQVVVTLSEPNTELINYFDSAIIPADYNDQNTSPIGTGPFKFVSYKAMDSVVIERYDDYYGTPAHLNEVTFKIYSNVDDAFTEILAGSIDIFPYISVDQAAQLEDAYNIEVGQQALAEGLYINNEDPVMSDVRVRQALSYAVDFEEIDEIATGGVSSVLKTGMFPSYKEYYNAETESYYKHDSEKAKELLADAGYADGLDIEITIPNNYQLHVSIGEVIVDQLKDAGINATIKQVDWSTWLQDVYSDRNYQTTIIALDATLAPGNVLRYYYEDNSSCFTNFNDAEFNELYDAAVAAVDQSEKVELYKEAELMLTEKAASVFLMSPAISVAVSKDLAGYTFYPIYVQDMSKIYYVE